LSIDEKIKRVEALYNRVKLIRELRHKRTGNPSLPEERYVGKEIKKAGLD